MRAVWLFIVTGIQFLAMYAVCWFAGRGKLTQQGPTASIPLMWQYLGSLPKDRSAALCRSLILPSLAPVVGGYSRSQAVKGIAMAGPGKSAVYAFQKLVKMFKK